MPALKESSMHSPPKILGYRGSILLTLGVIWLLMGLGKFASPATPADLVLITRYIPFPLIPMLWGATGLAAVVCAFRTRASGDSVGWIALYVMPALMAAAYAVAWIQSVYDLGGTPLGWLGAAVYVALTAIVVICAGWPEPADGGAK